MRQFHLNHYPARPAWRALTVAAAAALLCGSAWAQTTPSPPRQPSYVDSTRTDRLVGVPPGKDPSLSGAAGATLLPYNLPPPAGEWVNNAPYPLFLSITPAAPGYSFWIYIDGRPVARAADDWEWTFTAIQVIIPTGSSFTWSDKRHTGVVTALANNATWRQTGIKFPVGQPVYKATYVPDPPNIRSVIDCKVWGQFLVPGVSSGASVYVFEATDANFCSVYPIRDFVRFWGAYNGSTFQPVGGGPYAMSSTYLSSRVSDVYQRDVKGPGYCEVQAYVRNNWDEIDTVPTNISTVAIGQPIVPTAAQCTDANAKAIYDWSQDCNNTGTCPPPPDTPTPP